MRASESPAKAPAATASTTPTPPLSPTSECNGRSSGLACDDDGVPEPGTTAVVIGLPDATPLLDAAWRIDPALVRRGVPAHVSLLYPFVPESALTVQDEKGVRSRGQPDGCRPCPRCDRQPAAAAHPCGGGRAGGADGGRLAVKVHRTARRPGRTVNTPRRSPRPRLRPEAGTPHLASSRGPAELRNDQTTCTATPRTENHPGRTADAARPCTGSTGGVGAVSP